MESQILKVLKNGHYKFVKKTRYIDSPTLNATEFIEKGFGVLIRLYRIEGEEGFLFKLDDILWKARARMIPYIKIQEESQ